MSGAQEVHDVVFFFKQKTAYEMLRSLVGSEMCIRDSLRPGHPTLRLNADEALARRSPRQPRPPSQHVSICLLYTSDAADDLPCVDLGGRRIIKKKKNNHTPTKYTKTTEHLPNN